jgi:hypothetical protein
MSDDITGKWYLVADNPTVTTYNMVQADGSIRVRQVIKDPDALVDQIAAERAAVEGKGWGDGRIIGRVPDALYHSSGLAQAAMQGDWRFRKKFWEDPDHARLRIMPGKL